ncbi:ISAs1 family transposase [Streptomyces sp. NPDC006435]|uniref:ISAs1 family transposase n=1 Tax=Streptomyces sp. NPDC006435 TaxID=3154300 RepID=UPI0033A2D58C
MVLAQRQVASKSNEIPSFAPLLDGLELENTAVTADALHPQHDHGACPTSRGTHCVAVVKKNHPGLYTQVRKLPWVYIPLGHRTRDHAHHRDEVRRLRAAAFSHLDYPGARQAIQVVRWRRDVSTGKLTIERVYRITSLSVFDATCAELATWIRGHWGIESLLHHVRDRTFREDGSKVRTGTLPRAMASLRNLAIGGSLPSLPAARPVPAAASTATPAPAFSATPAPPGRASPPRSSRSVQYTMVPRSLSLIRLHARRWAAELGWIGDSDTATQVVAELSSNALRHAHRRGKLMEMRLAVCEDGSLVAELSDLVVHFDNFEQILATGSLPGPSLDSPDLDEMPEDGRGLPLIMALAESVTWHPRQYCGKTVCARPAR